MKLDIQLFGYYDGDVEIKVVADTKDFEKGLDRMQDSSKRAGSTIKNIVAGLGITSLIKKGFDVITSSIDDATKRFDTLNNFPKVMSNLGIATKDAQKQIDRMSTELAGLPTTLDQGALAVQRFTSKNGDVKKSTDIFLALNNAILAGGASSEIQASALEQLSQSYSKGKMDMMEWRTIQMAMPAQLKQVATAMGVTTDELGEMLRQGDNTAEVMDNFMNTIIKLNKEGVDGFASFEKQARNSTGGIRTAITVAKTQVVKGVADMITGMNKSLKKSNLPSLSEMIAKMGKEAKKVLDNVANGLSKVDLSKVVSTIKTLIPIVSSLTAGFLAYYGALKLINAINLAKNIISATSALIGLTSATTLSKDAMVIFNAVMSANPVGLLVAGVAALAAGMIYLASQTKESDKNIKKSNETLKEYESSMKRIQKQKDEALSKNMNELYYYQSLQKELQGLVDENGRVKAGYEDRVNFIASELSKGLGIEIGLTDGIITNYQGIQEEITKTIEKKKAMAYFNAHEEEYNEALKKEATLQKQVDTNTKNRDKTLKNINKTMDEAIANDQDLVNYEKELLKYYKGEIEYSELTVKARGKVDNMRAEESVRLESLRDDYIKYNEQLEKSSKTYADNQVLVDKYRRAEEAMAAGHYDAVAKIFNDTVSFNAKTKEENNKKYEEAKASNEAYLKILKANQDKYGEDFIKSEQDRISREMEILKKEKDDANKQLEEKNKQIINTTLTGLNDQLKTIEGKKYEFRDAGNGLIQVFADGEAKGQPMATNEANKMVNYAVQQVRNGYWSMEQAGEYLSQGLANGIGALAWQVRNAATNIMNQAVNAAKAAGEIHSPSQIMKEIGKFFVRGFTIGIEDNKEETIKTARQYMEDVINEMSGNELNNALDDIYGSMQRAVDLETGKISANVELGTASKNLSQMISASASFDGTIEVQANIDGEKVWENQQKISQRKSIQYGGVR